MSYDPQFQQRIFEILLDSQYWPERQMRNFQNQQLAQLLVFSRDNVPFYKDRLANALTADGEVNWQRWHEIPILTREDLLTHREQMLAPHLPPGHGSVDDHLGSGTTGKPVTSRHNSLVPLVSQAALFRAFDWHQVDYNKISCSIDGDDPKLGAWPQGQSLGVWGPHWMAAKLSGQHLRLNRNASPEEIAEFLSRNSVSYLTGLPSRMYSIARATERLGLNTKLDGIMTLSESPSEFIRDDCWRIFGAKIVSTYSSKEVYNIAHQCSDGLQYHVNSEMVLVEVVDDDDRPCAQGQRGRAIVTSFFNTAQPFIRYDLGDQIIMGEKCSCGRNLPVIEKISGRTPHLFQFPGGRTVSLSLRSQFLKIIAAQSWQIAQTGPLHLEVRYIPDHSSSKPDFDSFTELLRLRTDERVEISYKVIKTLPLTTSGKFIEFVSELPPDA